MDQQQYNNMKSLIESNKIPIPRKTKEKRLIYQDYLVKITPPIANLLQPIDLKRYLLERCRIVEDYLPGTDEGAQTYYVSIEKVWQIYTEALLHELDLNQDFMFKTDA